MLRKIILFVGLAVLLVGCNSGDGTEETGGDTGENPTEVVDGTEEPNFNEMSKEEIEEFFEGMTVEEIQEITAEMDPSKLVDKDGDQVQFPDEAYENSLNAGWNRDFNSEELGSGVNPAGVGEKVSRELEVFEAFAEFEEGPPTGEPGVFEVTLLDTTTGEEAWNIIASDDVGAAIAEEPVDFDYVVAEFEITLVEGPEYGIMIPVVNGTVDPEGNKLFELEFLPPTGNPLAKVPESDELLEGTDVIDGEAATLYAGETITGELVGKIPQEGEALLELIYNGDNYLFFEIE